MSDTDFSDIPGIAQLEKAFKLMGINVNLTNQEVKREIAPSKQPDTLPSSGINSVPSKTENLEFQQPFRISWKNLGNFSAGAIRRGDGSLRPHYGMDLQAPVGTPIYPIAAGIVESVSFEAGEQIALNPRGESVSSKNTNTLGGTTVWVKHPNNLKSYYAHLKDAFVRPGQKVTLDTPVGSCGNTGNARHTSSHLHLGVQEGGRWVDPAQYIGNTSGATKRVAAIAVRLVATGAAEP